MNGIRATLMGMWLLLSCAPLHAQMDSCAMGDSACYQRQYEQACAERTTATVQSCEAWIREVTTRASPNDRVAQLHVGHAHMAIANFLSADDDVKTRNRERGMAIFQQLIATDPADAAALGALAAATDDREERIRLLRQVAQLAPAEIYALRLLASDLQALGGAANLLEAAEAMRKAYAAQTGPNKWHLASRGISLYEEAGAQDRARELRQQVHEALDHKAKLEGLSQSSPQAATEAAEIVKELCYPAAMSAAGADHCLEALDRSMKALSSAAQPSEVQSLADTIAATMADASQEAELSLYEADPNWRTKFAQWMQSMVSQGLGSIRVYTAYASVELDETKRLQALERAQHCAGKRRPCSELGCRVHETAALE